MPLEAQTLEDEPPSLEETEEALAAEMLALKNDTASLKVTHGRIQAQILELQKKFKKSEEKFGPKSLELKAKIMEYEVREQKREDRWVVYYAANLLTTILEKISTTIPGPQGLEPGAAEEPRNSFARYIRIAASLDEKTFVEKTGLPPSCFQKIKLYPQFFQHRDNPEFLGEGVFKSEGDFALLLMAERYREGPVYRCWEKMFKFGYGKTVEEVYAKTKAEIDSLIGIRE
ncbi:hypothetical protein MMC30_000201 [Trapelia coarctata]|nr:hypothetical protein [Trapelia coarctata]